MTTDTASILPARTARRIAIAAVIAFVLFFGLTNWFRQVNLLTSQFDMGNMDQTLWHTLHGQFFTMSDPTAGTLQLRTATHADYLLLLYLPFYALFTDPRTPLVLQVLLVATGAFPLFRLATRRLGEDFGALFVIAYLVYPTLGWALTFDVHAVVLAAPLLLWVWWAASERRWWVYYAAIALALLAKEDLGLTVAAIGIYWGFRKGYRTMGAVSIVAGITWVVLMLHSAIPAARGETGHFALGYYSAYGGSYGSIAMFLLTHPLRLLSAVFGHDGRIVLEGLLAPVGFTALFGLPVLLLGLPELLINVLSDNPNQHTIFFHYFAAVAPIVLIASVEGMARLQIWGGRVLRTWTSEGVRRALLGGFAFITLLAAWLWAPLPLARHSADALRAFHPSPYRADVNRVRDDLRSEDRVVATNNLVPQFSGRDRIWGFPNNLGNADAVVVLDNGSPFELVPPDQIHAAVVALAANPAFRLVFSDREFWYFRKVP